MSKRILVPLTIARQESQGGESVHGYSPMHYARQPYLMKLAQVELTPLFVSSTMSTAQLDDLYALAGGMLLMGGADVDAARYRAENHPTNSLDPDRDRLEFYLVEKALRDRKPLLAICRGCQVLNVACGGTLIQHLPDLGLTETHGKGAGKSGSGPEPTHAVQLESDSKARALVGANEVTVPSAHHQAVKDLGRELRVAAKSPQGVIEIIEHVDPGYFCFGIQSHPEIMERHPFENFFSGLMEAVRG